MGTPVVGDVVRYVDQHGNEFSALVVKALPQEKFPARLNLAHVSHWTDDEGPDGRMVIMEPEVKHREEQFTHGNYWRELEQEVPA